MKEVDDETIEINISAIQEAKNQICELAKKYSISRENSNHLILLQWKSLM